MECGRLGASRLTREDSQSLGHYEEAAPRKVRRHLAHRKRCEYGTTRGDIFFDQLLQCHCGSMNGERRDKSETVGKLFVSDEAASLDLGYQHLT